MVSQLRLPQLTNYDDKIKPCRTQDLIISRSPCSFLFLLFFFCFCFCSTDLIILSNSFNLASTLICFVWKKGVLFLFCSLVVEQSADVGAAADDSLPHRLYCKGRISGTWGALGSRTLSQAAVLTNVVMKNVSSYTRQQIPAPTCCAPAPHHHDAPSLLLLAPYPLYFSCFLVVRVHEKYLRWAGRISVFTKLANFLAEKLENSLLLPPKY